MSRVILLCADHPLPLYDSQTHAGSISAAACGMRRMASLFSPMSTTALRWMIWSCP